MNTLFETKQPKIGRIWAKSEHVIEHNRIVAGLKATIQMLLSQSVGSAKRIRELENENAALKAKLRKFAEQDKLDNLF